MLVSQEPKIGKIAEMIEKSLMRVGKWVEDQDYKGYEPFDGLSSYIRPLVSKNLFLERILQQLVRQSPVNLRPLLGIKPRESTKGRGYMAWGYLNMFKVSKDPIWKEKAFLCLDWLDRNKSPKYMHHSWGNSFDYASRSGRIPKDEPTIVWTSLIGQVFLEAYELFLEKRHLDVINSIKEWILSLPREQTERGLCLSYIAPEQSSIHNSNMLGSAFLSQVAQITGDSVTRELAREAMLYSCTRQLPDGAWYYGEDPMNHWIDNFHTGYNLDSLHRYIDASGSSEFTENLKMGYDFFKNHFFEDSGCPKYYYNRMHPIDIQCAAQAIDTLVLFCEEDQDSLKLAEKVAAWTIDNMQGDDGHFYYRIYPGGIKAKAPMIHWGQATMFKSLASLLSMVVIRSRR